MTASKEATILYNHVGIKGSRGFTVNCSEINSLKRTLNLSTLIAHYAAFAANRVFTKGKKKYHWLALEVLLVGYKKRN